MRIGLALRSIDEKGGVGVYTNNIVEELLRLDHENEYFLFYRNEGNLGRYSQKSNATERFLGAPNKFVWDHVSIPMVCIREKVDVLFHPKFTVPLLSPCKSVMVLHGAGWFIPEFQNFWKGSDLRYARIMMPIFCRRASAIISVSQRTTEVFNQVFNLPTGKIRTVYFAPAKHFRRVKESQTLNRVKERYQLPENFILTLTKPGGDSRKNLGQILKAYAQYHRKSSSPYKLVIGGRDAYKFRDQYQIPNTGFGQDILFPGWIEQEDIPSVYTLAGLFLYPSKLEAFPIPVTEAMACGTPMITSNTNGLMEIAGEAAFFVNPDREDEISTAIEKVLSDRSLHKHLSERGLERAKQFNWEKCARETLQILVSLN